LLEREQTILSKLKQHLDISDDEITIISPSTPFSNKIGFSNTLRSCQGYIHWVDKYFSKAGLVRIFDAFKK
jgi:hypothetical protein